MARAATARAAAIAKAKAEHERKEAAKLAAMRKRWRVELSAQDRKKLEKALRGNIFRFADPTKTMRQMGLTPLHMPFGSDQSIIDFARAGGLKSVPHLEAWVQAGVSGMVTLKMASVGAIFKGMTTLIHRFVTGQYILHAPTVGVDLSRAIVRIEGQNVALNIWDTCGACAYLGETIFCHIPLILQKSHVSQLIC